MDTKYKNARSLTPHALSIVSSSVLYCVFDKTSSTEPSAHDRRSPASHTTSTPGNGSALTIVHPAAGLLPPRNSLMGPGRQLGGVEAG